MALGGYALSRTQIGISVPRCDNCGVLRQGGYGQMMGWPHSGWVTVTLSEPRLRTFDFHSPACALAWLDGEGVQAALSREDVQASRGAEAS